MLGMGGGSWILSFLFLFFVFFKSEFLFVALTGLELRDQASLELRDTPAFVSQVLGLKASFSWI